MPMIPNFTTGTFSQKFWRQVGDIDDCWAVADIACAHAVAPWLSFPGMTAYRAAAGNPDDPANPDGGTIDQSYKAITTLWPKLKVTKMQGGSWTDFIAKVKAGRCASASVLSSALPSSMRFGFLGRHRVSVYWNGSILRLVNPLASPHSIGPEITEAQLKAAMDAYPEAGMWAIIFPTVDEAFKTHPLYVAPVVCPPVVDPAPLVKAAVDANEKKWEDWVLTHP